MRYKKPNQKRALAVEARMLQSFDTLLASIGYRRAHLELLADTAGTTKSAFLSRFGNKKNALMILFERYCSDASKEMIAIADQIPEFPDACHSLYKFSIKLEQLQTLHLGSNRGMQEIFIDTLEVDQRTQAIFLQLVDLMRKVQNYHLRDHPYTDVGAFSAAQILVTINYNFVLNAMPALPKEENLRHEMIAKILVEALKF